MSVMNRTIILNTLIEHETMTIDDIALHLDAGLLSNQEHMKFLLDHLKENGHIQMLAGVTPQTYTITEDGIREGKMLHNKNHLPL